MVDGDVLREGPDAQVAGSGIDLVADLVVPHAGPDPRHDTRDVVPQHERRPVLQEPLELAVADHPVQRVDAGGTHPDQDVTGPDGGIWHLDGAEAAFAIFLDDECLHADRLSCRVRCDVPRAILDGESGSRGGPTLSR
jgi:hypothetical protein